MKFDFDQEQNVEEEEKSKKPEDKNVPDSVVEISHADKVSLRRAEVKMIRASLALEESERKEMLIQTATEKFRLQNPTMALLGSQLRNLRLSDYKRPLPHLHEIDLSITLFPWTTLVKGATDKWTDQRTQPERLLADHPDVKRESVLEVPADSAQSLPLRAQTASTSSALVSRGQSRRASLGQILEPISELDPRETTLPGFVGQASFLQT